jgi:transcription initiation factor TFIID subunit 9B
LLNLASTVNRQPLPPIPESYGIRLPPERERLTAVNFDIVPRTTDGLKQEENGVKAGGSGLGDEDDEEMLGGRSAPPGAQARPNEEDEDYD